MNGSIPDYAPTIKLPNKEGWINVYLTSKGDIVNGYCFPERLNNMDCKILYRIHVRLK